jgi:hypothetical protein
MTRCLLPVEPLVPPPIDTAFAFSHDASCEHPAAVAGAKVENRFLVFQARQHVFCTGPLDARAPNQIRGLACAGHGAPRAALVMNDLRIRRVAAQHPVESHCQLACRCHLGYSLRLAMATVLILLAQSFIQANRRLPRFHQQHAHETVALFADWAQPLLAAGAWCPRFASVFWTLTWAEDQPKYPVLTASENLQRRGVSCVAMRRYDDLHILI